MVVTCVTLGNSSVFLEAFGVMNYSRAYKLGIL